MSPDDRGRETTSGEAVARPRTAAPIHEVHRPGWEHETRRGVTYMVWAPRPASERHGARRRWAACWSSDGDENGDFWRGDSLDEVLVRFPAAVRPRFRRSAAEEGLP